MAKIAFIEPKSPGVHIFSMFPLPRLGTILLATIAKQEGWDASVYIEEMQDVNFSEVLEADIVGISTITSTAPRAYEMAEQLRSRGKVVIMGGPHVSFLTDEAVEHCDYVFRGEAEESFRMFVKAWDNGRDFSNVPGISYKAGDKIVHHDSIEGYVDIATLPRLDFSLIRSGGGFVRGFSKQNVIPVQTTRGCPYNCVFCSVTEMFGRKVRYREVEDVIDELKQHKGSGDVVFFYDDNFVVNKKRTKHLLERMIEEDLDLEWTAQVRADLAKDAEMLALMRKSGCFLVYIGFETINQKALDAQEKSVTVAEIEDSVLSFKKAGIKIHGMFVLGFEEDSYEDMMATVKFSLRHEIATVQYIILTPLPGTVTYARFKEENRLLFSDWSLYDGHHVVFQPKNLPVAKLQKAQLIAHLKHYSTWRALQLICRFKVYKALVAMIAMRYLRKWKRNNKLYLRAIELMDKTYPFKFKIDVRTSMRDIREMIEKHAKSLEQYASKGKHIQTSALDAKTP